MENSWQVKRGSTLQSSTPSLNSSSSQELRNEMEINTGYYFYPHGQQDIRTAVQGRVQDISLPHNNSFISSQKVGNVSPGNSFLSLLSGPPSLLQTEFQELSNPKPLCGSGKLISDNSSVLVNATGSRIPLAFSGLPSENLSEQNLHGAGFCPTFTSRPVTSANGTSGYFFPDLQSLDVGNAAVHCIVPSNEKLKGSFSLSGDWRGTCQANVEKASDTRVKAFQVKSVEANSSTSNQSYSFMSGCSRVFCLGTGGYLLLSNTGLLGIVCSCHCIHMSVLKFCEHSGLFGVNPGDAVHVDGGETIAQWRKVYFQKFGIRVPEDQSDWDWPEGLSTTAGLLKSRVTTPSISSNISFAVHPSESLVKSGQLFDNAGLLKNLHTDHNSVIDALQNEQKQNVNDNSNILLKGLMGTSQSKVRAVADNQITECPMSRCSTMSKFVGIGSQDGGRFISGYIDSILKNGNSSISYPALQDLKTVYKESNFSSINTQGSLFVGKDAAISNIELKLGQPYQSSQNSENAGLSVLGPQLLDSVVNLPPKSVFPKQIMHNTGDLREKMELGQNLYSVTGASGLSKKREQNQLNLGNCAARVGNSADAGSLEKLRGNLVQNSVVSLPTHSKILPESGMRTKANDNILNCLEHIMHNTQYSGSFALHNENGLEMQSHIPELGLRGLTEKGKGVSSFGDKYCFMKDSGFKIHNEMEVTASDPHFPSQCGNNCFSHQCSSLAAEVPDAKKICNYPDNVPFNRSSGEVDHVNHRSMAVHMGFGLKLPSQAVSKGIPLSTSTCLLDQTSALSREEGIGINGRLLDDNLRLFALRQILDSSKQQNAISSLGMNKWEGKYNGLSYAQHSFSEPSVPREQWHGPSLTSKMDVCQAVVKACLSNTTCWFDSDKGMKNCSDFSTMAQGILLHPKELAAQCQLSNDHPQKEQPSMRCDKSIAGSSEPEKCCCSIPSNCFQQNCNCSVRRNYFERNFDSTVGNFHNVLKEQIGMVNGEASTIFGPKIAKSPNVLNDKMISLEQRGLSGKLHKSICSNSSQWRDVPSKVKGVFDAMRADCLSDVIDGKGCDGSQHRDSSAKCFNDTMQVMDSLKENEVSNISSGCSAPAVTQVSVEVNNTDSCSADASNSGCVSDLVIDEGSGIDKCWSSDDAEALGSEKSSEFYGGTCKTSFKEHGSSKNIYHQSARSLLDELKLINSLTWKKGQNQIQTGIASQNKDSLYQKSERGLTAGKRKRDCSSLSDYENSKHTGTAELPSCLSNSNQIISSSSQGKTHGTSFSQHSYIRKFSSRRKLPRKRDIHKLYNDREEKEVSCGEIYVAADSYTDELSGGKEFKMDYTCADTQVRMQDPIREGVVIMKNNSVGCAKSSSLQGNVCQRKPRPTVCGKYGELSNGKQITVSKSAKIVSLSKVLKSAKRCTLPQNQNFRPTFVRELKKSNETAAYSDEFHHLKTEDESSSLKVTDYGSINYNTPKRMKKGCSSGNDKFAEELPMLEQPKNDKNEKDCLKVDTVGCQSKMKEKEVRERSIYELTVNGKNPCSKMFSLCKTSKCFSKMKAEKLLRKDEDRLGFHKADAQKAPQVQRFSSLLNSDAFCCVCGSSNKDEFNYLLECSHCLIKVHQACYGVSRVPKGHWYCRPCRTNSKDAVCVLCGYGGGAMTRALQARAIAKTFLRALNIRVECRPKAILSSVKTLQNKLSRLDPSGSGYEEGTSLSMFQPENIEPLSSAVCKMETPFHLDVEQNSPLVNKFKVPNSIIAGLLDPTTKQWVHMVCALWTPTTRCPNVVTMSAFDVSGTSRPKTDVVCSICCRSGGSCIQCRVIDCCVQFHPWCAHQKGLLQSEVEGVDNESVGFYGRCMLHATHPMCETDCDPADIETGCSGREDFTCARTEGYNGRKHDGFCNKYYGRSKGETGCLVPQEQLNAWIHINGQKTCTQGLPKSQASDVEHDCRKEYARYKQIKGWKHLVVYKSGIHALGLYTSRFISRGEMVVEYVGEIVGQRVADKRENEYQSGRKLQYKSACYFFRIDKEHIIDATHKGGIARFVNHSCLPNCVAKVISVRNEKKVVFFAERDIFPGEEITYDYHFNHEDEGKKIPCFCNSKNCRRYLN